MGKAIPMHEVNCRLVEKKGDKLVLQLANRRTAVELPISWCAIRPRRAKPGDARSAEAAKKYDHTLRIPLALAQQKGIA